MVINGCRKHDSFEEEINKKIWTIGAEIFTPCAASRLVALSN
jgi:hypothetical protein